ncbi:LOW QUALITY PROTEIN: zinc finger CCCH domain-containing protein 3 [Mantella aurantiaca]
MSFQHGGGGQRQGGGAQLSRQFAGDGETPNGMEEERENLRRQIQQLQGLISRHKHIHGNVPAAPAHPRWRNPTQPQYRPRAPFRGGAAATGYQPRQPAPGSTWRAQYSLVNRTSHGAEHTGAPPVGAPPVGGHPAGAPPVGARPVGAPPAGARPVGARPVGAHPVGAPPAGAPPAGARPVGTRPVGTRPVGAPPAGARPVGARPVGAPPAGAPPADAPPAGARPVGAPPAGAPPAGNQRVSPACLPNNSHAQRVTAGSNTPKADPASKQRVPGTLPVISNHNRTLSVPNAKWAPLASSHKPPSDEAALPSTSAERGIRLRKTPPGSPGGPHMASLQISRNLSNATQGSTGTLQSSNNPPVTKSAASALPDKSKPVAPPLNPPKNTLPAFTPPRVLRSSKTKYTWVASPKTNPSARKVSPGAKKAGGGPEKVKSPASGGGAKTKRSSPHQKCAPKNQYKWKAQPPAGTASAPTTPSQAAIARAVPKPQTPETRLSHSAGSAGAAAFRDSGNSSYKIKSRTKLVRRRSTSRSPVEKKAASPLPPLTVKSRYVLRRKCSPRVKSPVTVKKSSPRGLVHLSKHRLRRLPPSRAPPPAGREGISPSSSMRSPSSISRVIKTRYRIVKRSSAPPLISSPLSTFSPFPYWKNRLLLLNRARQLTLARRCPPPPRWRKSLRCIEGAIYQVSANKLSKTWSPGAASKATPRTGKADVSSVSPGSLSSSRSATPTRYLASRAVQRSLAIIRQAQQKKAKKEYCMYYNRFGRCKRGDSCPFIHDPDKVAVCTMFLRGTCKLTDGTCPFSHKVSKDKMPVCSYFLKGICHKTDCPYSHVYVSRKAEVCPDFLKGYCPMGAKCKKKHTLLCPHYARSGTCPDGTKCKLQHRQKKRRPESQSPDPEHPPPSCKQRRKAKEDPGDQPPAGGADNVSCEEGPSGGRNRCPSFISLSSSPNSESTPTSSKIKPAEDTGKPLQIKPRL